GDKVTELAFLDQRQRNRGELTSDNAIVLHPFGRYCNGFKSAGEIDVLEAIAAVQQHYRIDPQRIVIAGFSMGGAGAWHLGAHYAEHWAAVHAGAGFAETSRYQRLQPQDYPPEYEQTLWRVYDVPNYVRNLFHVPVLAYSGEMDKQIQAARVMEEAYQQEGRELAHEIGPGMGHKYHPESLERVERFVHDALKRGRDSYPEQITLQTMTLRYPSYHWVKMLGLNEHWKDSRIDAQRYADGRVELATKNVDAFQVTSPWSDVERFHQAFRLTVDGVMLDVPADVARQSLTLTRAGDRWQVVDRFPPAGTLRKVPGLQGPLDDVWLEPFLVVMPSGTCAHRSVTRWVDFELEHLQDRWRRLFRGEPRVKRDVEVTAEDLQTYHIIVWGDPSSNALLRRAVPELPLRWTAEELSIGERSYDAREHVPQLIYPNPLSPGKYLVVNSGLTFRENHDRTNSLQNPKLPDWAVVGLSQDPNSESPGKIEAAGFFNETWQ
ncbi:MAG: prolyl oligopeptidase family serine peptidase, partial [Planctomycetales bacterium]|nr:prolyl oligopeptidase family serine peptidase [Planctomycetales bacterium]